MIYQSPRHDSLTIELQPVKLPALLAGLAQVAPPELVSEVVRTATGEEIMENPLHPDNAIRRETYHAEAWQIITRNYLINGTVIDWTDWANEEVAKIRDILGERAPHSKKMIFLQHVFTDPEQPIQLSNLVNAIQTITFFNMEDAGRIARLFRYPERWAEHIRLTNIAIESGDFSKRARLFV